MPRITSMSRPPSPSMHRQQGHPLGLLGTEAIAYVGPVIVTGTAKVLRRLADALVEAADMADTYDQASDAWNDRERLER